MKISKQQLDAAEKGMVVELENNNKKFVLISREMYDRLTTLEYEELDPERAYSSVLKAWDRVGSPDDATDYLDCP